MDTIFMNSKNSKKINPHRLLLSDTDNLDLKKINIFILASTIHGKI